MATLPQQADLLIEFLTEELPPDNLKEFGECFSHSIFNQLAPLCTDISICNPCFETYVTPRRFGVLIKSINYTEPTKILMRKGPAIKTSLENSVPTRALLGFMKSCNIDDIQDLIQKDDGYFYIEQTISGQSLDKILVDVINTALKKLPIAKHMKWGNNDFSFVRPVHNLLIMFGEQKLTLPTPIFGLSVVDYTYGHRIMSAGKQIHITNANTYKKQMWEDGRVIVDFNERHGIIKQQLDIEAAKLHSCLDGLTSPQLLKFVTGIVEYPVVLQGEFNASFLEVPAECLVSSMVNHQKYFALFDKPNFGNTLSIPKLSNKFLFVANIESKEPAVIISGNEKVLSARLSDAQFFYNFDKKHSLEEHVLKLTNVVYHNKLGTQYQRVERLQNITENIAILFHEDNTNIIIDIQKAKRAAYLAKADLTTEMVGEFPELQGIMGKYYAKYQGEDDAIATAIERHYYPRFSNDDLPCVDGMSVESQFLSTIIALADKVETLVGVWSIGLAPTGEKDPFALRRAAIGVVRILLNWHGNSITGVSILKLLMIVQDAFIMQGYTGSSALNVIDEVYKFLLQRLIHVLTDINGYNYPIKVTNSAVNPVYKLQHLYRIDILCDKLNIFATNSTNQELFIANKRIENILKKQSNPDDYKHQINPELLTEQAEVTLYNTLVSNQSDLEAFAQANNWDNYFKILEKFNQPISQFFEHVMVMVDDTGIRNNRICLLKNVYKTLNRYCILSELSS